MRALCKTSRVPDMGVISSAVDFVIQEELQMVYGSEPVSTNI